MTKLYRGEEAAKYVQRRLAAVGLYKGSEDGVLGPLFIAGLDQALAPFAEATEQPETGLNGGVRRLAWGARVSQDFRDKVFWLAEALGLPEDSGPDDLMSCMAWESNETFSPSIKNMAGSGATGLIQFMPKTAIGLGTTVQALATMTAESQLNYVYKYFLPFKGKLKNLGDLYMAILWPAGVGKPDSFTLWDRANRPTTYRQNSGLDINRDGSITRAEAIAKVMEKKARGYLEGNVHP